MAKSISRMTVRFGLAHALGMRRRLSEAMPLFESAEWIFRTSYGPQHPQSQQAATALQHARGALGTVNPMGRVFSGWFGGER